MRLFVRFFYLFLFLLTLNGVFSHEGNFLALQDRVKEIFQSQKAAVVRVVGVGTFFDKEDGSEVPFQNIGTGFFISADGHVMTSATVVYHASRVWVEYEGVVYAAEPVGSDLETAISVLKVIKKPKDFKYLHLDASRNLPEPGNFLLGITCKLAFDPGPSLGMVNGVQSYFMGKLLTTSYIRSDIPSEGGDAGAPVFDLNGRLVGMLSWTLPEIRSSFTLPASAVLRIRDDLIFSGEVKYAYLGVDVEARSSIKNGREIYVVRSIKGSPGDLGGLLSGDVILSFNDKKILDISDLHNEIFFSRPGQTISVKIMRGNSEITLPIKVIERPENAKVTTVAEESIQVQEATKAATPENNPSDLE